LSIKAIQVTLKDNNGKVLSGKTVYITINKKTYKASTNSKGLAIFKVSNLKGKKYSVSAIFKGDSIYKASKISSNQVVKAKVDLSIVKITKVKSKNNKIKAYKVTIQNKGSLKSKKTTLKTQLTKTRGKSQIKIVTVKAIAGGKKITVLVKLLDSNNHKFSKNGVFVLNPKKTQSEITYKNNKKTIKA
jgi:hypothetical protein